MLLHWDCGRKFVSVLIPNFNNSINGASCDTEYTFFIFFYFRLRTGGRYIFEKCFSVAVLAIRKYKTRCIQFVL